MTDALIVFAKLPVPGAVKTRLTTLLTPTEAAELYDAFLRDALTQYAARDAAVRLYLAPPYDDLADGLVPDGVTVHPQRGDGLGPRMLHAFVETFAAGYERIAVIGTDHPSLPPGFIDLAFEALAQPLAVSIGPSLDGGYYLLGMNELYPALFQNMTYSHDRVFDDTLDRLEATSAGITVLPPWYDVDTPETLARLAADLAADPEIAAPCTRAALAPLVDRYPALRAAP